FNFNASTMNGDIIDGTSAITTTNGTANHALTNVTFRNKSTLNGNIKITSRNLTTTAPSLVKMNVGFDNSSFNFDTIQNLAGNFNALPLKDKDGNLIDYSTQSRKFVKGNDGNYFIPTGNEDPANLLKDADGNVLYYSLAGQRSNDYSSSLHINLNNHSQMQGKEIVNQGNLYIQAGNASSINANITSGIMEDGG
ncbi:hypothetical protein, partial [Helicobacter sp. 13S00482-2]|uniref:hypothetical protein n=1 Tax=Helicobacter sp. 13S00482-2 TaxID=1476200 RepID=UPI001C5E4C66